MPNSAKKIRIRSIKQMHHYTSETGERKKKHENVENLKLSIQVRY